MKQQRASVHRLGPDDVTGNWTGWTHYELRSGNVVPGKDACIVVHDPWDAYRRNRPTYRKVNQPYIDFLELGRKVWGLMTSDSSRPSLSPEVATSAKPLSEGGTLILDFCNTHGLLGILPTCFYSIIEATKNGATQASPNDVDSLSDFFGADYELLDWEITSHFRSANTWFSETYKWSGPDDHSAMRRWYEDQHGMVPSRAMAIGFDFLDFTPMVFDIPSIRSKFFHSIAETNVPIPCLLSPSFWPVYSELLSHIGSWALKFVDMVDTISNAIGLLKTSEDARVRVTNALFGMNCLAAGASPSFGVGKSREVEEVRTFSGLLPSYALMFLWDISEGRRVLRCAACDMHFVTREPNAAYCSAKCRNTAQTRRFRAKRSAKEGV